MKKYIITILSIVSGVLFGQITIAKTTPSAQPANASVSLELGNATGGLKGIVLPWVTATAAVTGAVPGTIVFDAAAAQQKVKFAKANIANSTTVSEWVDLSSGALLPTAISIPDAGIDISTAKTTISTSTAVDATPGILVLSDNNKAMVLPRVSAISDIVSPSAGMMVYVTGTTILPLNQLAVFNGREWTFWGKENIPTVTTGTGRVWMDRNLGATQLATSSTDALAYGDLYQWGRLSDGHQVRTSPNSAINATSSTDVPGNGNFIIVNAGQFDWRTTPNVNLWQGLNGTNNPCPSGFRIPTIAEFQAEAALFTTQNSAGAFNSPLKMTLAGNKIYNTGSLSAVGSIGYYYTSTVSGNNSTTFFIDPSGVASIATQRATGASVRCIKN